MLEAEVLEIIDLLREPGGFDPRLATVCREGAAFLSVARVAALPVWQRMAGAAIWGLWRALYECPRCPGTFRAPIEDAKALGCPNCGGLWPWGAVDEAHPV